mmetsp:Transcript_27783/g.93392  ORF Transcript_27783/g.93392 Transcript_27783/m.93392 type:complete len:200 (+) Transcript_27783:814-1413(+)
MLLNQAITSSSSPPSTVPESSPARARFWNNTTAFKAAGPMRSVAILTAVRMQRMWIKPWPATLTTIERSKSDEIGRTSAILSMGLVYEKAIDAMTKSHPDAIICRSEDRAPSKDKAAKVYAEMTDSRTMICCCWSDESRVQRPWRTKSTTARIDGARLVNGAATLASPGRIMGKSASSPAPAPPSKSSSCWAASCFLES